MGALPRLTSYKGYARVPPDRLISGLLTVNIRNSYDNSDGKDATNEAYYTEWSGDIPDVNKKSNPYGDNRPPAPAASTDNPTDYEHLAATDQTGSMQSFGDFDCFLFWVSGGMTLSSTLTYGEDRSGSELNGYASTSGTWYESISDRRCNSYIRSQLIGRSNNAYGHGASYFQKGTLNMKTLADAETNNLDTNQSTYLEEGYHSEYVMNTTTYSDGHAAHDNKWNLHTPANNIFYSPVESISITGSHRLNVTSNAYSGSGGVDHGTLYQLVAHDSTFYSIVVTIVFFGYDSTDGASVADKIRTDYNINTFFQPFGETPDLDFSTTEWAS